MIKAIKQRSTHRSKIIEGQFKALVKAIEKEEYCIDLLTQSLAIQKSLRSLNKLILENHLKTCAKEGLLHDEKKVVDELLQLYELSSVRGQ